MHLSQQHFESHLFCFDFSALRHQHFCVTIPVNLRYFSFSPTHTLLQVIVCASLPSAASSNPCELEVFKTAWPRLWFLTFSIIEPTFSSCPSSSTCPSALRLSTPWFYICPSRTPNYTAEHWYDHRPQSPHAMIDLWSGPRSC